MKEKIEKNGVIIIWIIVGLITLVNGAFFLIGILDLFQRSGPSLKPVPIVKTDKEVIIEEKQKVEEKSKKFVEESKEESIVEKEKVFKKEIKPKKEVKAKKEIEPKKEIKAKKEVKLKKEKTKPAEKKVRKRKRLLFLNNFDNNTTKNDLGKKTWCFKKGEGVCIDSFYYNMNIPNTYNDRNGEYSLRLSFGVSKSGDMSGFSSDLNDVDLSGYRYLSFWVRGSEGGEIFRVRISDGVKASEISVKGFFPKGLFPYWRRVVIPLKTFKSIKKWNKMKGSLSFVFDYKASTVRQGVIYIDEIVFE